MSNTSALLPVQTAIYAALAASPMPLTAYDYVPEDATYPYVTIGESIETPDNQHGQFGSRVSATLHVWSRQRGFTELTTVVSVIIRLLDHAALAVPGRTLIAVRLEQVLTLRDSDPDLRHAVVRFTVETY